MKRLPIFIIFTFPLMIVLIGCSNNVATSVKMDEKNINSRAGQLTNKNYSSRENVDFEISVGNNNKTKEYERIIY